MEYIAVGSHDKSDWVLYKKSDPENEIWSSKNDIVNKTTAPSELGSQLEFSTEYILKLRYHDATNDIWSDWGELEFTTASRFSDSSLKFTMRADGDENTGFPFSKLYAAFNPVSEVYRGWWFDEGEDSYEEAWIGKEVCPVDLYINNVLSNERLFIESMISGNQEIGLAVQEPKTNDIIEFVLRNPSSGFILPTNAKTIKYIKSFLAPLPKPVRMKSDLGEYDPLAVEDMVSIISSFNGTFIEDIPSFFLKNCNKVKDFTNLFRNNSGITVLRTNSFACNWDISLSSVLFISCFEDCKTLTHVEKHIFGENNQSTPISVTAMFKGCSNLTSVDPNIFKGVSLLTVDRLFQDCTSLRDAEINLIDSPNINHTSWFADGCPTPITVRVKANSLTARSFKESAIPNVNIIEE